MTQFGMQEGCTVEGKDVKIISQRDKHLQELRQHLKQWSEKRASLKEELAAVLAELRAIVDDNAACDIISVLQQVTLIAI